MRKRSSYRPRGTNPHAGLNALRRTAAAQSETPLSAAQLRDLALGYSGALQALAHGEANGHDLATLAVASNVAMLLCEYGLGDIEIARAAQDACLHIGERALRVGRYAVSGAELRSLQWLIELHDAQLASSDCTEGVIVAALREVRRRVDCGLVAEAQDVHRLR